MSWRGQKFTQYSSNAGSKVPGIPVYHIFKDETQETQPAKETDMGSALWCDVDDPEMNIPNYVGHPFPAKDPDRKHFAQTEMVQVPTGNSYGQTTYQQREEITEEIEMCGYHRMKMQNPFQTRRQITNGEKEEQPTLEDLEMEDEQYRAGYDAAMERVLRGQVEKDKH